MSRFFATVILILFFVPLWGQNFQQLEFHGHYLFRLDNIIGTANSSDVFKFEVRRAYFDMRMNFDNHFSVRWTSDVMFDNQGVPFVRLKYVYATYVLGDFGMLSNLHFSLGQLPRPWISYQEKFNKYKVFEDMFLETAGLINSTDRGISFQAKLGGVFEDSTLIGENGRLGSIMIGLYNGGGYMRKDLNNNKTFEFRLTLRPLYDFMPHLLYVVTGVVGKANIAAISPLQYDNARVAFVNQYLVYARPDLVLSAQLEYGVGDVFGDSFYVYNLTSSGMELVAQHHYGFSLFGDFALINKVYIFGRYDLFKILNSSQVLNVFYTGFRYEPNRWSFVGMQYKYDVLSGSALTAGVQVKF